MLNFQINIFRIKPNPFIRKNLNYSSNNTENHNNNKIIIPDKNKEIESNNNKLDDIQEIDNLNKVTLTEMDYEFLESISKKKRKKKFNYKLNKTQPLYENKELKEKKNLISPQFEKPEQKTLINPNINLRKIYTPRIKNDDCKIF